MGPKTHTYTHTAKQAARERERERREKMGITEIKTKSSNYSAFGKSKKQMRKHINLRFQIRVKNKTIKRGKTETRNAQNERTLKWLKQEERQSGQR